MCGRTACTLAPDEVSRASRYQDRTGRFRQPLWKNGDKEKYRPSYNKSPQSLSPVLLSQRHFDKDAPVDHCVLAAMRWGLVPAWFRETDPNKMQYSTSNCRSESLLEKKSYKDPLLKGQRCVILADGFYEWQRSEKDKQPFFIYFPQSTAQEPPGEREAPTGAGWPAGVHHGSTAQGEEEENCDWKGWRLLTMAGLFDRWTPPGGGETLYTYTIITVNASPNLQGIHDRMPAVLSGEEEVRKWLDYGEVRSLDALKLLQPKDVLTFHPVSSLVNNSRNNSPECLQPLELSRKKPSASSRAMMTWLQGSTATRTPEPAAGIKRKRAEEQGKSAGPLSKWLVKSPRAKEPTSLREGEGRCEEDDGPRPES